MSVNEKNEVTHSVGGELRYVGRPRFVEHTLLGYHTE